MRGSVKVGTLYVQRQEAAAMPEEAAVVLITPLIRELISRVLGLFASEAHDDTASLVVALLLVELRAAKRQVLSLPLPHGDTLREFSRQVRACPSDRRALPEIARQLGLEAKTLSRRFRKETGMTPDAWRRHARLLAGVAKLKSGKSVTEVALDLGFESVSSFTEAFRQTFGTTPRQARLAPRK